MTNKPMLSAELRTLLERVVKGASGSAWAALDDDRLAATEELRALLDKPAECRCKRYGKDNPHWPCPVHAEPAAQHQGEPVAWVTQCHLSGLIEQAEPNEKATNLQCWSDAFPVFREQPAPVAVVMPERETYTKYLVGVIPHNANEVNAYKDGWNTCLEEVARLNGVKP